MTLAPPAYAQMITGNALYKVCSGENLDLCLGYVMGASDMALPQESKGTFCLPEGATGREMNDVVVKYLTDHPGERHLSAASIVNAALSQAFPC